MIAAVAAAMVLAAAPHAAGARPTTPAPAPTLAPPSVLERYDDALAALKEPAVFAFEYTLEQTGTRTIDQTHRVFRSGTNERDETLAVNGVRSTAPVVRVFRGRRYRYTVRALAPTASAYEFSYTGPHRDGKHIDYVFALAPTRAPGAIRFTSVTVDGLTFLPRSVSFVARVRAASGTVTFTKADRYWVASTAFAQAKLSGGVARERLHFTSWRFPAALPASTFAVPRPLPTTPVLPSTP